MLRGWSDRYKELEFEVENLEPDDEDSEAKRQQVLALLEAIRAEFPDWPDKASMMVAGSFTPAGSQTTQEFKVYLDAEIEVERAFATPLDLSSEGVGPALTIEIDPGSWFLTAEGVMDLSEHDYDPEVKNLLEFELEMEHGFKELSIGQDD